MTFQCDMTVDGARCPNAAVIEVGQFLYCDRCLEVSAAEPQRLTKPERGGIEHAKAVAK